MSAQGPEIPDDCPRCGGVICTKDRGPRCVQCGENPEVDQ